MADRATDESDQELAIGELRAEEDILSEVNQAIRPILDGTYRRCELSGKPISAARLRAIPWTRFSKAVKEAFEKQVEREKAGVR